MIRGKEYEDLEQTVYAKINDTFSVMVKELNDCTNKLLQATILSAENLENSIKEEFMQFQNRSENTVKNLRSNESTIPKSSLKTIGIEESYNYVKAENNDTIAL